MLGNACKYLIRAGHKIKLRNCPFLKDQIHYLGHLVSGTSIHQLADKIEAVMRL